MVRYWNGKFKNDEPDDDPVDLRQSRKRLSGRKGCFRCHPYVNPMQSCPLSLIWSLLSRKIDWSIVWLCICLVHFYSDRIWLYGGFAMAGQEFEGDLWDQSLGLDLLNPSTNVGFRTLSLTSVQNFGSSDPRLRKLGLDQASHSCCRHAGWSMSLKGCFSQDMIKLSLGWGNRSV